MTTVLNPLARAPARVLGLAGLIPFVGLTVAMYVDAAPRGWIALAQLAYAATIVSFIGALHWGLAMRDATLDRAALWQALGSVGIALQAARESRCVQIKAEAAREKFDENTR